MRIALAGNPNSGKTTMYNALTGRNEKVGNWTGVTVSQSVSPIKKNLYSGEETLLAVDLPGAYSMSPFTSEESITSEYVQGAQPDAIINIVDATNLSRSLFFTTQLLELGIPVVVALNKSDLNVKKQTKIDTDRLSALLKCPVIETVSTQRGDKGLEQVVKAAVEAIGQTQEAPYVQPVIHLKDKEAVEAADRKRFEFVNQLVAEVETRKVLTKTRTTQDKVDLILAHRWLGIPIFVVVMFLVFFISQTLTDEYIASWLSGQIETFQSYVEGLMEDSNPFLRTLLTNGIIGGVGAVVGFLPLIMVMYFLISLLEDCGYMARVSVVMDRIFKRVGLSGRSIIPMVIGTGCSVPGVMACRTIRDERERRTTAMLTPFMPCGAKLPIIALFAGLFFDGRSWVQTLMYFVAIGLIFLSALMIRTITGHKFRKSFFIIELPEYRVPSIKRAFVTMLQRAKDYILKAATIILVCNVLVHILQTFNWHLEEVEEGMESTSILASIASPFAVILIPLGFGIWQLAAAAIAGFVAKENVVGTLAVVYGLTRFIDPEEFELLGGTNEVATALGLTTVTALAYLMFNLYTPPCFAAIGAMNTELGSKKWLLGGVALQLGTGYVVAFLVNQIGTLITTGHFAAGFLPGLAGVLVMVAIVVYLMIKGNRKANADFALRKATR